MVYILCIQEPYYRTGFFRMERFTDLNLLEEARKAFAGDNRRKHWVQ